MITDDHNFKIYFNGIDSIRKLYGQSYQDLFALTMLNGKKNGTFLEIGCNHPIEGSNSYVLEKNYNFTGISIDISSEHLYAWDNLRPGGNMLCTDAINIDYSDLLKEFSAQIDYLQIDIDEDNGQVTILENLLKTDHRFSVITYETDVYRKTHEGLDVKNIEYKEAVKEKMDIHGYMLLVENVSVLNLITHQKTYGQLVPYEDWYIDPTVIPAELYTKFFNVGQAIVTPEEIFLKENVI